MTLAAFPIHMASRLGLRVTAQGKAPF